MTGAHNTFGAADTARLELDDVTVMLKDRVVLDGLSLDLAGAGLVALAGPNGAGKSTLLKTLAGLLPTTRGQVRIAGNDVTVWPRAARSRAVAYIPQDRTVHWPLSARAIVALGRLPHQETGAALTATDHAAIERAMATMDVSAFADRPILELSGGERARVLMARALAQEPRVLLADEPAAGLDPAHQWALFQSLAAAADQGMRVIVVLHDLTLASRFARQIVLMSAGRIDAVGVPSEVFSDARLARVYNVTAHRLTLEGHDLIIPTGPRSHTGG